MAGLLINPVNLREMPFPLLLSHTAVVVVMEVFPQKNSQKIIVESSNNPPRASVPLGLSLEHIYSNTSLRRFIRSSSFYKKLAHINLY